MSLPSINMLTSFLNVLYTDWGIVFRSIRVSSYTHIFNMNGIAKSAIKQDKIRKKVPLKSEFYIFTFKSALQKILFY
ncbi:MAG TPA: hypothetical protein DC014_02110 [Treponema sp.]|nr:hypothetical protein [Treponema sp.]